MPKRYYSHPPSLRAALRSTYLVRFLSGLAFGICAAGGVLFVLWHAQERSVTSSPIYATTTAPTPTPEPIEPIVATVTAPTPSPETVEPTREKFPSTSVWEAAADHIQSRWSLQLIGNRSETRALEEYGKLQKRFPAILGSRAPVVMKRELGRRGSLWYQIRVTEVSRERADALCTQLREAGGECLVLRE